MQYFNRFFAPCEILDFELAPEESPISHNISLGQFDCISGGAITSSALFVLARIPGVSGYARVIEPDIADLSNLNRYPLQRRSHVGMRKVDVLEKMHLGGLKVTGLPLTFAFPPPVEIGPLAENVLVGVDNIPSRWDVQRATRNWLGIGATTHWSAMASFHKNGLACARCLHSRDDGVLARIPTVSFVSFLSGLLLALYFVRHVSGGIFAKYAEYVYLTPTRPEAIWCSPIKKNKNCPICYHDERLIVA